MHIRPAEFKDIPQLVTLGLQLFELHISFDPEYYSMRDNFDDSFAQWVREQIAIPGRFLLVAEENGKILGFISGFMKALFPWFTIPTVGHISFLIIDKQNRRKGIGTKLHNEAVTWFKAKNVPYIETFSDEANNTGIMAWNSFGYLTFKRFLRKKL